ncbi:MAG: type II toxin-antitoxin system mRNA interferase toxin, RelE/StbE family [Deltaproteobacteria bacterium]|nr:MAG: type II toxin-antitoxin system mRNA interferase toxin, RelE/StbE family [Deltaproteobacteria bacterium]
MVYKIVYKKSVHRDLKKLDKREASNVLDQIENDLSGHPASFPVLKGKFSGLRKYPVGDYKVIYVILEADVVILRIGHQREVYKK